MAVGVAAGLTAPTQRRQAIQAKESAVKEAEAVRKAAEAVRCRRGREQADDDVSQARLAAEEEAEAMRQVR